MLKFFKIVLVLFVFMVSFTISQLWTKPAPICETFAAGLGIGGLAVSSRLAYKTYTMKQYGFRAMAPRALVTMGSAVFTVKLVSYGFKEGSFPHFVVSNVFKVS